MRPAKAINQNIQYDLRCASRFGRCVEKWLSADRRTAEQRSRGVGDEQCLAEVGRFASARIGLDPRILIDQNLQGALAGSPRAVVPLLLQNGCRPVKNGFS